MKRISGQDRAVYGRIVKLTGPIILQNLLSAAVQSADVVMLNFVGQEHISAVSLATQYATVLFMILYGLGTGVTMLSAQYFGKGDMRAVDAVEGIALRFSLGVTILFASAALAVPEALHWTGGGQYCAEHGCVHAEYSAQRRVYLRAVRCAKARCSRCGAGYFRFPSCRIDPDSDCFREKQGCQTEVVLYVSEEQGFVQGFPAHGDACHTE